MKLTITNKNKARQFITIFKHLKDLVEITTLIFKQNGVYFQAMDSTHICLCELNLLESWFDTYEYKSKYDNELVSVSTEIMFQVIDCYKENNTILIEYNNKTSKLIVSFRGENSMLKEFTITTFEYEDDIMEIPDADYTADISIVSSELAELISELSIFSNDLTFNCDEDWIKMFANGDNGTMKVNMTDNDIISYAIEEEAKVSCKYSIEYFKKVCSFWKINSQVDIHLNEELPIKIVFDFDEKNKEAEEDEEKDIVNYMKFYIAPKLNDEDEY